MNRLKTGIALMAAMGVHATQASELEVVAELNGTRPGNLTVTEQGRVIMSMHPLENPKYRVMELLDDGTTRAFPTEDWADGPELGEVGLSSVIGIDSTKDGTVWMLDMGSASAPAQIVAWDSVNHELAQRITLSPSVMVENSFFQDFALDTQCNRMYIADTTLGNIVGEAAPAFVVVDLNTGQARRVLESHKALMAPLHQVSIDGSPLATKRQDGQAQPVYLGLNPITIDANNEWVYFGTVNGSAIYRLPAAALADPKVAPDQLAQTIEFYSEKRPSDGMVMAGNGRIYVGDLEKNAIGVADESGYRLLAQDDQLLNWVDGFALGKGYLYLTQNALHLHPVMNEGEEEATKPYRIVRLKLE
ncbi:major royal jelly family protein [Vibrio brasiliensis]|uniref:major royal jelly family protein n=1 Tax=Vibrio brasiliensis TaxID=170652 RepID=UPI001EFD15F1|nr:major royal jelly family protein [Vibrio brasiliensis]MCG9784544.1 major royal jelly family protein [Vibrio brasiliensis]